MRTIHSSIAKTLYFPKLVVIPCANPSAFRHFMFYPGLSFHSVEKAPQVFQPTTKLYLVRNEISLVQKFANDIYFLKLIICCW